MRLTIYVNDDLAEFEGNVTATSPSDAIASAWAEFPLDDPDSKGYFVLASPNGDRLHLYPIYTDSETWAFRPTQNTNDVIPDVTVNAHGYIERLEIGSDGQEWEILWKPEQ